MKLNPPASSSDIEVAREIARRLHQRRRREDRPDAGTARAERPVRPAPPAQSPAPPPIAPIFEPTRALAGSGADGPAPPTWDTAPPNATGGFERNREPEDALDALTAPAPAEQRRPGPPAAAVPAIEIEDDDGSTEADGVPGPAFQEADAYGGAPTATPFDDADALPPPDIEPNLLPSVAEGLDAAPFEPGSLGISDVTPDEEELFDDTPARPSWGDIAERCMNMAHARGALLADAGGELVAARGEWPDPGAEAIASRLVAMMDRTLKDAPTRSVSAPVGNLHLTAWRVPAASRLLTVVFIADAQVRADTRPTIDAEVQRSAAGA